jgi:3-hydroxyacyl-[acyl-carrier-protein] dehydratase
MAPVEDLLPHRRPWLLVDRVLERAGDRVRAEKRLSAGDPLLAAGALPDVLVIEALAQAAACVAGRGDARAGLLVAASGFEFAARACAGETLTLTCARVAQLGAMHRFTGEASVDGKLVARGELTFALGAPDAPDAA